MSEVDNIEKELMKKYDAFFEELGINKKTGIPEDKQEKRFSSYPFIGSKYGENDKLEKILFVALTTGFDPATKIDDDTKKPFAKNGIWTIEERRECIEYKPIYRHNMHISGSYTTALYFLRKNKDWETCWNNIKKCSTHIEALEDKSLLPSENLLSLVALTNIYKFVKVGETKSSGSGEYIYKNTEENKEEKLVYDEIIEIFKPDIIIFQSTQPDAEALANSIKGLIKKVYIVYHPSYRFVTKIPEEYVKKISPI